MNTAITIETILKVVAAFVAMVGGGTAVYKVVKFVNDWHDKIQKYDSYEGKIEETHADTEAKLQQIIAEQYILTKSMLAVLEGLKQQGCNGPVTKAKEELERYLVQVAHDGV